MAAKRIRNVALGVGAAWAGWWVFFEMAEAIPSRQFTEMIIFVLLMFGAVALGWKWPAIGGTAFLMEGAAAIIMFAPMWAHRFTIGPFLLLLAMMPLPPLVAGFMLLVAWRLLHTHDRVPV